MKIQKNYEQSKQTQTHMIFMDITICDETNTFYNQVQFNTE